MFSIVGMISDLKIERRATSLQHQVQEVLRAEIASGRLVPGERLVEQRLCQELDVSRTSLREALRQLEAEHLVDIVPHRGAVVALLTLDEARKIYEVRRVLEALAARDFTEHAADEDIVELRRALSALEDAERRKASGADILAIKQQFYHVLLGACGNDVVHSMLNTLNNRISVLRSMALSQTGRLLNTVLEIREIVEAIERRDPDGAHAASLRHVESSALNAIQALSQLEAEKSKANKDRSSA